MLAALAMSAWLTVSGHAEHFEQAKYNEENYGIGFEVEQYSAGVLKDSNENWSPYAAYRFDLIERGEWASGFALMATYRQYHPEGNWTGYTVAPLPYARWTDRDSRLGLNIIAAPLKGGFVFFQLRIRLGD